MQEELTVFFLEKYFSPLSLKRNIRHLDTMIPFIFSCEHATCAVPEAFKEALRGDAEVITSSHGWDLGALNLAQSFAMKFRTPLTNCEITRLLIDCHLPETNPDHWGAFSQKLPPGQKEKLHERLYLNHINTLRQRIATELERHSSVVHISFHTFDPADKPDLHVSLLFSEGKIGESQIGLTWLNKMGEIMPDEIVIQSNREFYPKQSKTILDLLRTEWPSDQYIALEIQVSNRLFLDSVPMRWDKFKAALQDSLKKTFE